MLGVPAASVPGVAGEVGRMAGSRSKPMEVRLCSPLMSELATSATTSWNEMGMDPGEPVKYIYMNILNLF